MRARRQERGSALLVAMVLSAVLLMLVAGLMLYAGAERRRAVSEAHGMIRVGCAEAGLQLARAYFAGQGAQKWNAFLSDPIDYNPVPSTWNTSPATPGDPNSHVRKNHPELFFDLDGDGAPDVYIYVRDNQDELPPAPNNWARDNDQNVYVGAMCISSTLVPMRQDQKPDPSLMTAESLLSYNVPGNTYKSQAAAGASGTGNIN